MNHCGEPMRRETEKECGATFHTYTCLRCGRIEVGRDPQELAESVIPDIDWYGIYGLPCVR